MGKSAADWVGADPSAPASSKVQSWGEIGLAALCIGMWLAATAWIRPLMLPDEGRYVSVAWEMLRSGEWLTPTLNGLPFFHKPPLFYWITALSLKTWGLHEGAARAAPLFGAWLAALSVYGFTLRWHGVAVARRAAVVLLAWPLFYLGAQFANLDMLVAGCIVATVMALADAALRFEQGRSFLLGLLAAYFLAALGVLAKGLIGFVLPALVVGCWLVARRRWRTLWALLSLPGLALFAVVCVPWFWLMQQRFPEFLHYFFVVQHLQRFSASGFNNVQAWWFYVGVLGLSSMPLLLWARSLLQVRYWQGHSDANGAGLPVATTAAVRQLMGWCVVGVTAFFSWPQSKLLGYVLPAVPALAWLVADASAYTLASHPWRRWCWRLSISVGVVLSWVVIGLLAQDHKHSARDLGLALAAQRQPGEPVYMVQQYLYDTAFYAQVEKPIAIVDDWGPEASDNWRKELLDAAEFVPVQAPDILLQPARWQQQLCAQPQSWVIGEAKLPQTYPALAHSAVAFQGERGTVWRVDMRQAAVAAAWGCGAAVPDGG